MAEITVGNRREARLHIYIWSGRAAFDDTWRGGRCCAALKL